MLSMERECVAHVQRSRILKKTPYDGTNRIRFIGYNLSLMKEAPPFSGNKLKQNIQENKAIPDFNYKLLPKRDCT